MRKFLRSGFDEFKDPVVRYFGVALALIHLVTIGFYLQHSVLEIAASDFPVCWPFFPNCFDWPAWSSVFTKSYLTVYGVFAAASAFLFFSNRLRLAWVLSALSLVLKFGLLFKDYRMMGNYHYMIQIAHLLFLLYPLKRQVIGVALVGFYVAAGTLKFNFEWLSGAALLEEPIVKGWLLVFLCAYVVILEMIVSFALMSTNRKIFALALAQFLVFHIYSYGQVGFFYPVVMIGLLSIFYLPRILNVPATQFGHWNRAGVLIPVLVFVLAQFVPAAFSGRVFGGESAITGEGRIFSLNMFDARTDCQITERAHFGADTVETDVKFRYMRIRCDPISVVGLQRARCAYLKKNVPSFRDLDVYMNSKINSGTARPVLRIENFCEQDVKFSIWSKNGYIL